MKKLPGDQQVKFLEELIATLVRALVEHEDRVQVACASTPARVVFTVYVHHDDMGLVIGEGGKTGDALRRIVWTAAKKTDRRVDIDFV
ncbi:MAG TPA: KH domain-containing protein [Polyangia bacterium]